MSNWWEHCISSAQKVLARKGITLKDTDECLATAKNIIHIVSEHYYFGLEVEKTTNDVEAHFVVFDLQSWIANNTRT